MKNKKMIVISAIFLLCVLAIAIIVIVLRDGSSAQDELKIDDISTDASLEAISIEDAQSISGMFVEDGSDEVLNSIFAVDFKNNSEKMLQYAKLVLTVDGEEFTFEISTVPAGATVRAMEMNKKDIPHSSKKCEFRCENVAWFEEEPDLCADTISIIERDGGLIVTNESEEEITAPIYLYYKNCDSGTYIGGITYRAVVTENLTKGQSTAVGAQHFNPGASEIIFVTYAK